jgi:hypothetical protein
MAPAINQLRQAMGFCKHFPRVLVFTPTESLGLGIKHIHTVQEVQRLETLKAHTATDSFTGSLYHALIETLILEVSLGANVLNESFNCFHLLAKESAIKTTWEFMWDHQITLQHDIAMPSIRKNDTPLMTLFVNIGVKEESLRTLNKSRLYLKIFLLSDIYNQHGTGIHLATLQGKRGPVANNFSWPRQGEPAPNGGTISGQSKKSATMHISQGMASKRIYPLAF